MTLDLILVHQSEEDLQLRGELEMLVERLKVRIVVFILRRWLNICPGARYYLVPTSTRDTPHAHPDIYIIHDFRAEAFEVSATLLSRATKPL